MKLTQSAPPSRATWLRLAGTILSLVLLVVLLAQQGWAEIGRAISQIPVWRLALALLVTLISRMAVAGRWHVLLRASGLPTSFGQSLRLTFAGLFASNFLPTTIGGDVVRLAGAIQLKFDAAISATSLVVDRLVGMAGMAMALPFGIPSFLEGKFFDPEISLGLVSSKMLPASLQKIWQKFLVLYRGVLEALARWLHQPQSLLFGLALSWVHMLCLFFSIYVLLDGMREPVDFWLIAGLWSVVYFITLIPISINGYGLQEVSMAVIFTRVGGISTQAGLTIAILIRTLTMLASLPGALYVPGIMAGRESRDAPRIEPQPEDEGND